MVDLIWVAVIVGFALWWMGVHTLNKAGILKRFNMTAYGPLIMWRTYRGQGLLNALASPKTFWKALFSLCIPLVFVSMFIMLAMIVIVDIVMIVKTPAPSVATAPQNILVIPGVNEFVPFVWGWLALVVAMVVHEIGHAVMGRAENIKVKSLGLLLAPIPLGAFAELDEEEMFGTKSESTTSEVLGPMDTKAAGEGKRTATSMGQIRILSAGVISNFLIAIVAFLLLFGPVLGAIGATNSQMVVVNVAPGTPAYDAGIQNNLIVHSVDGVNMSTPGQFNDYLRAHSGSNVTIEGMQGSQAASYTLSAGDAKGLYVLGVVPDFPAAKAGIGPNMQIVSVNNTAIRNYADYNTFMANTTPGQTVDVGLIAQNGTALNATLALASGTQPKGYMGFGGADLSDNAIGIMVGTFDAQGQLMLLQNMLSPVGDSLTDKALSVVEGIAVIMFMPLWEVMGGFTGISVFQSDLASLYHPIGWAAGLGNTVFYMALALFWIGWLNMNVGLFNCLPMIPLDGGHIFREVTRVSISRFIRDNARVERLSRAIVNVFAITLFSSLVFMILAPYIVHGLA